MRKLITALAETIARRQQSSNPSLWIHPKAKVAYRSLRIRPHSSLRVGEGSIVEGTVVTEREGAEISIGKNTFVGNSVISCAARIDIGDDVLVSWGCNIVDHNSHAILWQHRMNDVREWYDGKKNWIHVDIRPVKIGDKSWLGFNVGILKGVTIGEGAIVGAGSIVTKDVPAWTIVAGNPAKIVKKIEGAEP